MRKVLNILARLLTGAAIALILLSNATKGSSSGLWGGVCVLLAVLCGFLEDHMKRQDNQKKAVINVEATVVSHHQVRERVGRNPRTKETITIPAAKLPAFKASKTLKDAIAK